MILVIWDLWICLKACSDEKICIFKFSFDRELKRLLMEEEASGSVGLSMYDRVKQRSSSKPGDAAKKTRALELLQERAQSRRINEQNVSFFFFKESPI
ncbi:unnamed protein product [Gongylonema pulchrum]|uniref:Uncharacterized protein n=1 Tax=Gongylonema pulchrum TaxID=637853 RepID=A0A183EUH6_9BILA|nr:unnamed protein product [Gongylonema pulchrum]